MRYEEAFRAARWFIDWLRPACLGHRDHSEAISIAGSLRRRKNKDFEEIDLIAVPDLSIVPPLPELPLFSGVSELPLRKGYPTILDRLLGELEEAGRIEFAEDGPRSKRFTSKDWGIRVDLYLVRPPATWGVQYAIRTGPSDFSQWIVTQNHKGGALPDGYRVQAGAVWVGEDKVKESELLGKTPVGFETEESFFEFLGLDWIEPESRRPRWGRRW